MSLDVHSIFSNGANQLIFKKEHVTPRFPHFIDYDIEDSDWTITQGNGNYDIEVKGKLNFSPIRQEYDDIKVLLAPSSEFGSQYGNDQKWYQVVPVAENQDDFTFKVDNIPDSEEAHFCLRIEQSYNGIEVFVPENSGWQIQVGMLYNTAIKEIHEMTTSIPVKKVWDDKKDHSGDKVELCLVENEKETSYKITLSAENGWEGKFKHVPYERWTYSAYGAFAEQTGQHIKIPLKTHEYTVKELNVKPGYTPIFSIEEPGESDEPEKPETPKPGKSYPVQAVYTTDDGKELTLNFGGGVVEYKQGDENQRFFLNGNDTLIFKFKNGERSVYIPIGFEQADEKGKYCIYENDPYEGKVYYQLTDTGISPAFEKSQATAFEFRDFATGEVLKTLPTDVFQPRVTAFEVFENGQATGQVLDLYDQDDGKQDGFSAYSPGNPYQKYKLYSCDGQLVALTDLSFEMFILLEPCKDVTDQFLLRTIFDPDEPPYYFGRDEFGLMPVKNAGDATHFTLVNISTSDSDASKIDKVFTVTNTPGASLVVSKTVSGAGVDQNKAFTFTVTLGDTTINGTFGDMTFQNGIATFTLKHGQKKTATGLPAGITYEVVETDNAGYTVTVNGGTAANGKVTGTLVAAEAVTLAFNNGTATAIPQTGDPMNMALWLAMLAVSALVLATLFASRKKMGRSAN